MGQRLGNVLHPAQSLLALLSQVQASMDIYASSEKDFLAFALKIIYYNT